MPSPAPDPFEALARDLAALFPADRPLLVEVEHGIQQTTLSFALGASADLYAVDAVARGRGAAVVSASRGPQELTVKLLVQRPADAPALGPASWRDHLRVLVGALAPRDGR